MKNLFILLVVFGLLVATAETAVSKTATAEKQPAQVATENAENLPVVDNSSDDSYEMSVSLVRASVPPDAEDAYLDGLIAIIAMVTKSVKHYSPHMRERMLKAMEITRKIEDGKNYKQIIAYSKEMMNTLTEQAKKDFIDIISESEKAIKSKSAAEPIFTKIELSKIKLRDGKGTMRLKNNTPYPLGGVVVVGIDFGKDNNIPAVHFISSTTRKTSILPNEKLTIDVEVSPEDAWLSVRKPNLKNVIWEPMAFINDDNGEKVVDESFGEEINKLLFFKEGYAALERQDREELFNDEFLIEVLGDKAEEYFKQRNFI